MLILYAILFGLLEGATEFLPVSSTGHLIVLGAVLGFTGTKADSFEVIIQLGAILAVVVLYFQTFLRLFNIRDTTPGFHGLNGLKLLFITTIPPVFAGLALHGFIKAHLFTPLTVAGALAVGGVVMIIFEHYSNRMSQRTTLETLSTKQALSIGLFQSLALWPGVSRSAATILGAVGLGLTREAAVEYSFLAAVPVMVAATGYDLLRTLPALHSSDAAFFITGFLTAFIAASVAIRVFLGIVKRVSFSIFGWYRIALALVVIVFAAH